MYTKEIRERLKSFKFEIRLNKKIRKVLARPLGTYLKEEFPQFFYISLDDKPYGTIYFFSSGWSMKNRVPKSLVRLIAKGISKHYKQYDYTFKLALSGKKKKRKRPKTSVT